MALPLIFGTLDTPFFEPTGGSKNNTVYGAWVVTNEFYKSLVKYGGFDEYHFFCSSNLPGFRRIPPEEFFARNNIKIQNIEEFPFYLQNTAYTVFFTSLPSLARLSNLRYQYAARLFPVCGMAHSMSYQDHLMNTIFTNLIADLTPFDSVICSSRAVLQAIRNLNRLVKKTFFKEKGLILRCPNRLDRLPLGINADHYGRFNRSEARKKLNLPKNKILLLYFGRLSLSDKADLYPLLVAFKNLLSRNKNIFLLLAGSATEGGYVTELKKLVKGMALAPCVKFYSGPTKKKELLYSASDIFVSPSDNIQESFGLTVLEAMASGLPVVVSDWDGYRDIVIHGKTGFKVPAYWANCDQEVCDLSQLFMHFRRDHIALSQSVHIDTDKMTEYLSILVRHKQLRRQFGLEGQRRVLQNYDWRVLIPAYEKLWKRLSVLSQDYKIKRKRPKFFVPKYFDAFRHYASSLIDKNTAICIGQNGILAAKTRRIPRLHPEIQHLLSIEIIFMILIFLLERRTSLLGEIQNYVSGIFKQISCNAVRYHVMWLLKNNFLKLG